MCKSFSSSGEASWNLPIMSPTSYYVPGSCLPESALLWAVNLKCTCEFAQRSRSCCYCSMWAQVHPCQRSVGIVKVPLVIYKPSWMRLPAVERMCSRSPLAESPPRTYWPQLNPPQREFCKEYAIHVRIPAHKTWFRNSCRAPALLYNDIPIDNFPSPLVYDNLPNWYNLKQMPRDSCE